MALSRLVCSDHSCKGPLLAHSQLYRHGICFLPFHLRGGGGIVEILSLGPIRKHEQSMLVLHPVALINVIITMLVAPVTLIFSISLITYKRKHATRIHTLDLMAYILHTFL